jgi:hypothetical protein
MHAYSPYCVHAHASHESQRLDDHHCGNIENTVANAFAITMVAAALG